MAEYVGVISWRVIGCVSGREDVGGVGAVVCWITVEDSCLVEKLRVASRPFSDNIEGVVGVQDRVIVLDVVKVGVVFVKFPVLDGDGFGDVGALRWGEGAPDAGVFVGLLGDVRVHVVDEVSIVGDVRRGVFVRAEVDGFAVEPRKEDLPDCFHGRDGVWMADVEHAEVCQAEFWSPLHDGEGMTGCFDFRDDGDTTTGALALDVIELAARVRLVGSFVEPG